MDKRSNAALLHDLDIKDEQIRIFKTQNKELQDRVRWLEEERRAQDDALTAYREVIVDMSMSFKTELDRLKEKLFKLTLG